MKVLLVASSGGHLTQLWWMAPWWSQHVRTWVSFPTPDARSRLAGESVVWAHHPTNRHPGHLARNAALAWRVLRDERPDLVVSTGAGVAVPFLAAARVRGVPTIFVEVYDRVQTRSWTGRIVAPFVDAVVLQWQAQREAYPDGVVLGPMR